MDSNHFENINVDEDDPPTAEEIIQNCPDKFFASIPSSLVQEHSIDMMDIENLTINDKSTPEQIYIQNVREKVNHIHMIFGKFPSMEEFEARLTKIKIELLEWKNEQRKKLNFGLNTGEGLEDLEKNIRILTAELGTASSKISVARNLILELNLELLQVVGLQGFYCQEILNIQVEVKLFHECVGSLIQKMRLFVFSLAQSSFVVEVQPTQAIKVDNNLSTTVRLLFPTDCINFPMVHEPVSVLLINESMAIKLYQNPTEEILEQIVTSGNVKVKNPPSKIWVNCAKFIKDDKNALRAIYSVMQINKITRAQKGGCENPDGRSIGEQKHFLLFQTELHFKGEILKIWTISQPLVIYLNGKQEVLPSATVAFHNAFCEILENPTSFDPPSKITWSQLKEVLSTIWKGEILLAMKKNAEKLKSYPCDSNIDIHGLTTSNLEFLAQKLGLTSDSDEVSLDEITMQIMPGYDFTFWEWFYGCLKLTRSHMAVSWSKGLVEGFVQKSECEKILKKQVEGTFIVKFSENFLGSIAIFEREKFTRVENFLGSIALVEREKIVRVDSTGPIDATNFAIGTFVEYLRDWKSLKYFYTRHGKRIVKSIALETYIPDTSVKKKKKSKFSFKNHYTYSIGVKVKKIFNL